jgi:hypothetical protein
MANASLLFHANLLYAEFPFRRIPEIIDKSYLPVLRTVLAGRDRRAVFNFSGFTLEVLAGEHPDIGPGRPEVLELLREGLERKQIEVTGSSWAHAVLPTLPPPLQSLDIGLYCAAVGRLLGAAPTGFFPPELGISPLLPEMLVAAGYRYAVVDRELALYSRAGYLNDENDFKLRPPSFTKLTARAQSAGLFSKFKTVAAMRRILRTARDYAPLLWEGTGGARLPVFTLESAWIAYALLSLSRSFPFRERRLAGRVRRSLKRCRGLFFPYSSDVEFFGLGGNTLNEPIPVSRIDNLFRCLERSGVVLRLPGELVPGPGAAPAPVYLKAGSWSTDKDFALWRRDPDNAALDELCLSAWRAFREKEGGLPSGKREACLKNLLLAWNSDGRGWTPLPEHRLFCYNKAKQVLADLA